MTNEKECKICGETSHDKCGLCEMHCAMEDLR